MLGLGSNLTKGGAGAKTIVTDNLVLKHGYAVNSVQPLSDGAADINADAAANEYIDVGAIPITTNDVTMSAWVYVTEFVDYAGVISNRMSSGAYQGIGIRTLNENTFSLAIDEATDGLTSSISGVKNTNQWYHVCGVIDRDGSQYLYVDGVLEDSDDISDKADSLTHTENVFIGKNYGTTEFRGYICNVGYWNRVLTQAEVKSIMNKNYADLTTAEKTSLVSWWNLDSNAVIASTTAASGDSPGHFVYDNHFGGGDELGSELSPNVNFDSGITGWTDYASGTASYDSSTKALKLTNDSTNTWMGMTTDNVAGIATNSKYLMTGRVYMPTGWSGGDIHFTEGDSLGSGAADSSNAFVYAVDENLDQWQDCKTVFETTSDAAGRIYIRSQSTPDDGDYILLDNLSIKKINGNPGKLQ